MSRPLCKERGRAKWSARGADGMRKGEAHCSAVGLALPTASARVGAPTIPANRAEMALGIVGHGAPGVPERRGAAPANGRRAPVRQARARRPGVAGHAAARGGGSTRKCRAVTGSRRALAVEEKSALGPKLFVLRRHGKRERGRRSWRKGGARRDAPAGRSCREGGSHRGETG